MSRIKLAIPEHFQFSTFIPIRITDLNYGNHVGNDAILTLVHEARVQYLHSMGYSEMNVEGTSLIMGDAGIEFKKELLYGQKIEVQVTADNFSRVSFDLYYKILIHTEQSAEIAALIKTGMICFDYNNKKVTALPAAALAKMKQS